MFKKGPVIVSNTSQAPAQSAAGSLARLLDDERAFAWREDPLAATADGERYHDDRLPTVTPVTNPLITL